MTTRHHGGCRRLCRTVEPDESCPRCNCITFLPSTTLGAEWECMDCGWADVDLELLDDLRDEHLIAQAEARAGR